MPTVLLWCVTNVSAQATVMITWLGTLKSQNTVVFFQTQWPSEAGNKVRSKLMIKPSKLQSACLCVCVCWAWLMSAILNKQAHCCSFSVTKSSLCHVQSCMKALNIVTVAVSSLRKYVLKLHAWAVSMGHSCRQRAPVCALVICCSRMQETLKQKHASGLRTAHKHVYKQMYIRRRLEKDIRWIIDTDSHE